MLPQNPTKLSSSKPSGFLRTFFIVIALILFGILVGVLAARFLPMSGTANTPTPPVPTAASGTPTPTIDETANWKTYTNKTLGISFKHPDDWVATETEASVVLLRDPDMRTVVGACPGYSFSVSKYNQLLNYSRFDKVAKSELNGESTEIWTNNNSGCKERFVFVNSLPTSTLKPKYIISFISKNLDGDEVLDQILSTFKFGDNTQTSLIPADSQTPAAGICAQVQGSGALITLNIDTPSPRCTEVSANQTLTLKNGTTQTISLKYNRYETQILPGSSYTFPQTVGLFLAPGVHNIAGAEVWLH